jgi:hypothetical protein
MCLIFLYNYSSEHFSDIYLITYAREWAHRHVDLTQSIQCFCTTLIKMQCWQILVKLPKIKFHEN